MRDIARCRIATVSRAGIAVIGIHWRASAARRVGLARLTRCARIPVTTALSYISGVSDCASRRVTAVSRAGVAVIDIDRRASAA
jgi:hypothetical protein